MNPKITPEHLGRAAVVYVRQSTPGQVAEHLESQRRQYALADCARSLGFASVVTIDDDLGRSGAGLTERPGFQKLVATVCGGTTGAVFCIEASRKRWAVCKPRLQRLREADMKCRNSLILTGGNRATGSRALAVRPRIVLLERVRPAGGRSSR